MSEESTGAIGGAAQGAAAGAQIAGPYGAIVGAVIGGVMGFMKGSKERASRLAFNKYTGITRDISYADAGINRRDAVRSWRIQEAQQRAAAASETGGLESSAPRGALSSAASQRTFNLGFFDWRVSMFQTSQFYLDKAGKYAAQASNIGGLMQGLSSAAQGMTGTIQGQQGVVWGNTGNIQNTRAIPGVNYDFTTPGRWGGP
jgi:hypothetical protein